MSQPDTSGRTTPATGTLRFAAALTSLVVAAASITLAYVGLVDFARDAGIDDPYTLLFPLPVIGMVAIGFLEALQAALAGGRGWFGRSLVLLGVAVLAAGAVGATEERTDVWNLVAFALPPVALLLTLEALLHIVRRYGPPRATLPRLRWQRGGGAGRDGKAQKKAARDAERSGAKGSLAAETGTRTPITERIGRGRSAGDSRGDKAQKGGAEPDAADDAERGGRSAKAGRAKARGLGAGKRGRDGRGGPDGSDDADASVGEPAGARA